MIHNQFERSRLVSLAIDERLAKAAHARRAAQAAAARRASPQEPAVRRTIGAALVRLGARLGGLPIGGPAARPV
jgi:hypothetical protein